MGIVRVCSTWDGIILDKKHIYDISVACNKLGWKYQVDISVYYFFVLRKNLLVILFLLLLIDFSVY